jgi:hypothetical protein
MVGALNNAFTPQVSNSTIKGQSLETRALHRPIYTYLGRLQSDQQQRQEFQQYAATEYAHPDLIQILY